MLFQVQERDAGGPFDEVLAVREELDHDEGVRDLHAESGAGLEEDPFRGPVDESVLHHDDLRDEAHDRRYRHQEAPSRCVAMAVGTRARLGDPVHARHGSTWSGADDAGFLLTRG